MDFTMKGISIIHESLKEERSINQTIKKSVQQENPMLFGRSLKALSHIDARETNMVVRHTAKYVGCAFLGCGLRVVH